MKKTKQREIILVKRYLFHKSCPKHFIIKKRLKKKGTLIMTEKQQTTQIKETATKQTTVQKPKATTQTTNRANKKETPVAKTEKTTTSRKPKPSVATKKVEKTETKAEVKQEVKPQIKKETVVTKETTVTPKEKPVETKAKEVITNTNEKTVVTEKKEETTKQETKPNRKPASPVVSLLVSKALQTEKEIAEKQKSKEHQPTFHRSGFYLTIETPEGNIGLWSSWTESSFYLGYPLEWHVEDELIMDTLGVKTAQAVYHEKYVGSDKPCEVTTRKWGRFYSDVQETGGRVWVDKGSYDMNLHTFPYIENKQLQEVTYGHTRNNKIATYPFHQCNERETEAPTTNRESIQMYRDSFFSLALLIANEHGGVKNVHIRLDETVWIPENLQNEGYTDITYLKGNYTKHEVLGDTVLYAKRGEEELVLQSGNSITPWINNRKFPVKEPLTVETIHHLLTC